MKTLLFLTFSILAVVIRWLRFVALAQQKEYRADRLLAFFKTVAGRAELFRLPRKTDFTRTGLKRPRLTPRAALVAGGSLVLASAMGGVWWWYVLQAESIWLKIALSILILIVMYFIQPVFVFVMIIPTVLVAQLLTNWQLKKARRQLAAHKPMIIGITGSYGKTSTKQLVAHVLSQEYSVFVTPKSHNTRYSVARAIAGGYTDQALAVIEYGAYAKGEIKTLAKWFPPQVAVVTGLAPQHLELFGSLQAIMVAKSELVRALPADGVALCNGADPGAMAICQLAGTSEAIDYSGTHAAEQILAPGLTEQGKLTFVWRGHMVTTQLYGVQHLQTAQAAIAIGLLFGLSEQHIVEGLSSFTPGSNFTQVYKTQTGALIIDDGGTSNPTGFKAALALAEHFKKQDKKVLLFTAGIVDLGESSKRVHQELASAAAVAIDRVFYFGADGAEQFAQVFQARWSDFSTQSSGLPILDDQTVVLIEGRLPKWVERAMAKQKHANL